MNRNLIFCISTLILCLISSSQMVYGKAIHKEKSLYRNIVVTETATRRCLLFTVKRGDKNQSCINLKKPDYLVFPYARMTLAGLLLNHNPKKILIIGLGGGSIPMTLASLYPEANIDVVEIDAAVLRVAKQYFNFKESPRLNVHISDARVFIKRAKLKSNHYDFIILDAFTGEYIPEHLMTREFLLETKALLSNPAPKNLPSVLVANTFSTSRLYDHESVTYQQSFGEYFNFKRPDTGNRVIVASTQPLPDQSELKHTAQILQNRLMQFGVDINKFPSYMSRLKDWNESTRPLTDKFNPANLLQGESY